MFISAGNSVFADVAQGEHRVRLVVTLESDGLWAVQAIDVLQRSITWKQANLATKDVARSRAKQWAVDTFGDLDLEWKRGAASSTA